jgi:hypothetical protein
MVRKSIPEQTQNNLLIKSRRRCCLYFWLKGEDELKKGPIAHIDGDNSNFAEGNLVFLCLDHHDEYDSETRISKGLRQGEVKRWRDELYKEMEDRFRSLKTRTAELSFTGFQWSAGGDQFCVVFKLKNNGEAELRRAVVALRLPDGVVGAIPPRFTTPQSIDIVRDSRQDLFEPNGRVCTKTLGALSALMPGHSLHFRALLLSPSTTKPGTGFALEYRIDAEEMSTVTGTVLVDIPMEMKPRVVLPQAEQHASPEGATS